MFALKEKFPPHSDTFSMRNSQNANSDIKDAPLIVHFTVMKDELTMGNFIFGGTHCATRVCRVNPADIENVLICVGKMIDT